MASATEGKYAGEFLVTKEECGTVNFDKVTVLSGQNLKAGDVVGAVTIAGIGRASIPTVVGTGNGTMTLVTAGRNVQVGNYVVTCTTAVADGGVFSVTAPDGTALPTFTMTPGSGGTTAYVSSHINFSVTDGSTNFALADAFTIVVGTTAPTVIGGTGNGTISALALGPDAMTGNYRVINRAVVTNGGDFEVIAPDGKSIGRFLMGTGSAASATFTTSHIVFTLTDATDFILGNYFDIAVYKPAAAAKVVLWDEVPSTYDGRHRVAGISWDNYDASSADVTGVIVARGPCEVNGAELGWKTSISAAQQAVGKLGLAQLGIVAR